MIKQTILIPHATAKEIYSILLDSHLHSQLTGQPAVIDPKEGGSFSAYGGYATGRITKLLPGKSIEQTWRASDWEESKYSKIKFIFSDTDGGAVIEFVQTALPAGTEDEFVSGWQDYYWAPLKKYFS